MKNNCKVLLLRARGAFTVTSYPLVNTMRRLYDKRYSKTKTLYLQLVRKSLRNFPKHIHSCTHESQLACMDYRRSYYRLKNYKKFKKSNSILACRAELLLLQYYYNYRTLADSSSRKAVGTQSGTSIGCETIPRRAGICKSRNSMIILTNKPVGLSIASMLLCPAPSTQLKQ